MRPLSIWLLIIAACATAGCSSLRKAPPQPPGRVCVPQTDQAQIINAIEDVLRQMHFTIEKADPEQAVVITKPLSGAQFFEFWRPDNRTARSSLLANIHTTRRTVRIGILEKNGQTCIDCLATVQQLSLPQQRDISELSAFSWFSSGRAIDRLKLSDEQKRAMTRIDIGNDHALAEEILRRIREKINQS